MMGEVSLVREIYQQVRIEYEDQFIRLWSLEEHEAEKATERAKSVHSLLRSMGSDDLEKLQMLIRIICSDVCSTVLHEIDAHIDGGGKILEGNLMAMFHEIEDTEDAHSVQK